MELTYNLIEWRITLFGEDTGNCWFDICHDASEVKKELVDRHGRDPLIEVYPVSSNRMCSDL